MILDESAANTIQVQVNKVQYMVKVQFLLLRSMPLGLV